LHAATGIVLHEFTLIGTSTLLAAIDKLERSWIGIQAGLFGR
jgi:hypothetical protein